MVRKLALTSLFFSGGNDTTSSSLCSAPSISMSASSSTATSWQWPSCTQARTLSFGHKYGAAAEMSMRMMNPAYLLDSADHSSSCLSDVSAPAGDDNSLESQTAAGDEVVDEAIIRGLRSSRLFFEPGTATSSASIVKKATARAAAAFDGATAMAIDSDDPYGDFRRSMEEMVMSHGVDDWGWLEEMLGWYLKANGKKTHGLIVGAFVDLLVALTSPPSNSSSFMALQLINKGKHKLSDECYN